MKVLLAGGSGLIGRAICEALVAAGHDPVVLTRDPRRAGLAVAGVKLVGWNPPMLGKWVTELEGTEVLINLAGESIGRWPWTRQRKVQLLESRLASTRTLIEALAARPSGKRPAVFLSASGTDLYDGRDATPADETTSPADTFLSRVCLAWEREALRAAELGLRVVLMRTSTVIARNAPGLRALSLPFRAFLGGRLGSGRQWTSWVDRLDVVGLYLWAIETDAVSGPLNVSAPDPRPQVEFGRAIGRALARPYWFPIPGWVIGLILGEQAQLALGSRRVWPTAALAHGYVFRRPRLEESLSAALASCSTA